MKCCEVSDLLPALCFGELKQKEADKIHDHLAECDACMEEYLALAMALQKSKMPIDDHELKLSSDQRNKIRREAWSAELKIENKDLNKEINIPKKAKKVYKKAQEDEVQEVKKRKINWMAIAAVLVMCFLISAMILPSLGTARDKALAKKLINEEKQRLLEAELQSLEFIPQVDEMIEAPPPPPPPPEPELEAEAETINPDVAEYVSGFADIVAEVEEVTDEPASALSDMRNSSMKKIRPSSYLLKEKNSGEESVDIFDDLDLVKLAKKPKPSKDQEIIALREKLEEYQVKSEELALNLEEANGEVDELKNTVGRKDAEIARIVRQVERLTPEESAEVVFSDDDFRDDDGFSDKLFDNSIARAQQNLSAEEISLELMAMEEDKLVGDMSLNSKGDIIASRSKTMDLDTKLNIEEEQQVVLDFEGEFKKQKQAAMMKAKLAERKLVEASSVKAKKAAFDKQKDAKKKAYQLAQKELVQAEKSAVVAPSIALPSPVFFEGMIDTKKTNLSTFSIDVDTASYAAARSEIRAGRKVNPEKVRMEEFINHFDYHYSLPQEEVFAIDTELLKHRVYAGVQILRVGVQGRRPGADAAKPGSYTFVLDNSGSMAASERLPLIQKTLPAMFKKMKANDEVTILTCENGVSTVVERESAANFQKLESAVKSIKPGTVADLSHGIEEAYKLAAQNYRSGAVNRVVLLSDGIASMGKKEADEVLTKVDQYRRQGIGNTVIGVGSQDFDDNFLETLANKGDGAYYFGDSKEEMQRILVENFDASFKTIARDVKIQLEFNAAVVRSYRLLGYEKRRLANKDFRNDKVDAGEVGAGQSVTALYELVLNEGSTQSMGKVNLRYKQVEGDLVNEINTSLGLQKQRSFHKGDSSTRLAWCVSVFARLLKQGGQAELSFMELGAEVNRLLLEHPHDQKIKELKDLIIRCQLLY